VREATITTRLYRARQRVAHALLAPTECSSSAAVPEAISTRSAGRYSAPTPDVMVDPGRTGSGSGT
jgi:hypothetical protein